MLTHSEGSVQKEKECGAEEQRKSADQKNRENEGYQGEAYLIEEGGGSRGTERTWISRRGGEGAEEQSVPG